MDKPHQVHNNCSGKHAGMLILSKLMSGKTSDGKLNECGSAANPRHTRIHDWFGSYALSSWHRWLRARCSLQPLGNWARAFALFAGGGDLPDARHEACQRIRKSIAAEPCSLLAKEEHAVQSMQLTAKI